MGWATAYIEQLKQGLSVKFRPHGNSMEGRISSGQLVTVTPIGIIPPSVGEAVLCKVNGKEYLHLVKAIKNGRYQIGNNKGGINGWAGIKSIFGRVVRIDD